MNGFDQARTVEHRGMAILLPYLKERASGFVLTNKGPMAKALQREAGDVIFNTEIDMVWAVEVKVEEKRRDTVFLETWSNRNLESRQGYAERPSTRGWLDHLRSDLLWYYFLESDDLFCWNLYKLKRWAFGHGDTEGRIYAFPEKRRRKYGQLNDTLGRCVPIAVLAEECPYRHAKPRQLSLSLGEEAA